MSEMKTLTLNGKTYDSFVDKEAREAIENFEPSGGTVTDEQIASAVESYLEENPVECDGVKTVNGISPDENGNVEIVGSGGAVTIEAKKYNWIPRGLMREKVKTFQGWAHAIRYDERLGKAVGIVMSGEAAHASEYPLYLVTIDDNGYMSDYEEIKLYDTDGVTEYVADQTRGYVCGFCILSDGTYLIQDNTWVDGYPSFFKSTDHGKTFIRIESTGNPTQAFGLRQLSTGRIISGSTGGSNCFYYSDNLGETWSESNVLDVSVLGNPPFEADARYEFAEHCIVEFSNGTLLAIGRTSNGARDAAGVVRGDLQGAAIAYSDDHGVTWRDFGWSKTITNMTGGNAACVCIDGIYHLVMGDRYTYTTDELGNRRYFAMYYQWATEEDALNDNWSEPVAIDYGHWTSAATTPTDSGYPSLWKDASDNLHCVFYDGDGSGHAYGANWRLIDGSPCVESRAVSDDGGGSFIVSYSQAQVDAMLTAQRTALMKHINELYLLVGQLPEVDALDGSMFVTDGLVDYWEPENAARWSSDASAVESSLDTGYTIIPLTTGHWNWGYIQGITLTIGDSTGLAVAGGFYTPSGLSVYGITDGITIEAYCHGDSEQNASHMFADSATKILNKAAGTAVANATFYFGDGVTAYDYTGRRHKVATITDDTINLYIDGKLIKTLENTSDVATLSKLVYLNLNRGSSLAQVRIYNRVLTDEEIANNCTYTQNYVASLAAGE